MRRVLLFFGAFVALASAGFAGATIISADSADRALEGDGPNAAPDRGSVAWTAHARDPRGGPDWTLRKHTRDGRLCLTVGRRSSSGRFGHVTRQGFVEQAATQGGGAPCGVPGDRNTRLLTFDTVAGDGARTSVYGTTARGTDTVVITAPDGEVRRIRPANDGTYLAVFEGVLTLSGAADKEIKVEFE